MVDKRPRRNLDPAAEPWGRSVDALLDQLVRQNDRQDQGVNNAFKSVNAALSGITQQVRALGVLTQELSDQQQELENQQARLTAQQSTLSAQQSALNTAFNQIAAGAANEVTGASTSNSNGSPISVGSGGNYVGASVVVPAGFSRAIVTGYSSIRIVGSANMALYLSVNINGNIGNPFPVFSEASSSATTSASAGHAATLSGLSAGQVVTVWGRTTSVSGVSGAYFSNTASFIFLK